MGHAYDRAFELYRHGDYAKAYEVLCHDLATEPENARSRALGTLCNVAVGAFATAREWGDLALGLDPNEPSANYAMALLLYRDEGCLSWHGPESVGAGFLRTKRVEVAEQFARRAVRLEPGSSASLTLLASILYEMGNGPAAMEIARQSLAVDPRQCECHRVIARVFKDQGDAESAIAATNQAIACEPDNPASRIAHGWTLMYGGDHEQATDQFFLAARLDPKSADAREALLEGLRCVHGGYRLAVRTRANSTACCTFVALTVGLPIVVCLIMMIASSDDSIDLFVLMPFVGVAGLAIAWLFLRRPLYNWIIQFNDMGREFLSKERRMNAWAAVAAVFVFCGSIAIGMLLKNSTPFVIPLGLLGLIIPASHAIVLIYHDKGRSARRPPKSARSR